MPACKLRIPRDTWHELRDLCSFTGRETEDEILEALKTHLAADHPEDFNSDVEEKVHNLVSAAARLYELQRNPEYAAVIAVIRDVLLPKLKKEIDAAAVVQ